MFNNIQTTGKVIVFSVLLILSLSNMSLADSLTVDITRGAIVVNNDRTDARLLVSIDLPQELANAEVILAEILFSFVAEIPDSSALTVNCYPLLIAWDPGNIEWEDLGDTLGADVIGENGTIYAISGEGSHESYFDITEMTKAWLDGTIVNNGLIFFCDLDRLPRFRYHRNHREPFAQVRFTYIP